MSDAADPITAGGLVPVRQAGSGARAAVQIDRAELEDFQQAARLLLAHPLITGSWPRPGALAAVRRWELPLKAEFGRVLGYRLDIGRSCARLYRRAATTSVHRGAVTRTGRPIGRLSCSFLCLALAALEALGEQTTASRLSEEVLRLRAGDDALPIDLTRYDQRKAFVDAVKWLEDRGVLRLCDGTVDRWMADDETGDALYDVDRDAASRLLVASPSVLRDVGEAADFLVDVYAPTDDAQRNRLRHRIGRHLVGEPVVAYEDLDADELAYVRHRRTRLIADVEQLTGCGIEARAEGLCLVDASVDPISAQEFPAGGTEVQAALLWGAALVEVAGRRSSVSDPVPSTGEPQPDSIAPVPSSAVLVDPDTAAELWDQVVADYGSRFKADFRDAPDRLHREVRSLLDRLGLASVRDDGTVEVSASLARYRPTAATPGQLADPSGSDDMQMSLLGGPDHVD